MADDDNVIALPRPTKDEDLIFVCGPCGSLSFNLRGDGYCVCNICGNVICPECCGEAPAKWHRTAPTLDKTNETDETTSQRFETGSVELARKRVEKRASDPEIVSIHLIYEDGEVSAWTSTATKEQADWLEWKFQGTMKQIRAGIKD